MRITDWSASLAILTKSLLSQGSFHVHHSIKRMFTRSPCSEGTLSCFSLLSIIGRPHQLATASHKSGWTTAQCTLYHLVGPEFSKVLCYHSCHSTEQLLYWCRWGISTFVPSTNSISGVPQPCQNFTSPLVNFQRRDWGCNDSKKNGVRLLQVLICLFAPGI